MVIENFRDHVDFDNKRTEVEPAVCNPVQFADLSFSIVEDQNFLSTQKPKIEILGSRRKVDLGEVVREVILEGKMYYLKFKKIADDMSEGFFFRKTSDIVLFDLFDDENCKNQVFAGRVAFEENFPNKENNSGSYIIVHASVLKMDKGAAKSELPKGFGSAFYRKMLDYIDFIAKTSGKKMTHNVEHSGHLGLSSAQWNRVFSPILKDYLYNEVKQGEWVRVYN